MAKNNDNNFDLTAPVYDDRMPIHKPRTWNPRDVYQAYAAFILANNPQCWGKYNHAAKRRNYWIYMTVVDKQGRPRVVEVMNYRRWKAIMHSYFEAARDAIIFRGEGLSLGHLGMIKAKRIERNLNNKAIDWGATDKRPKVMGDDGKLKPDQYICFVDKDYVMIGWKKYRQFTNEKMYEFEPSNDNIKKDGFKGQFSSANRQTPALRLLYEYFPMKDKT